MHDAIMRTYLQAAGIELPSPSTRAPRRRRRRRRAALARLLQVAGGLMMRAGARLAEPSEAAPQGGVATPASGG
jgi:hypothetical protein